MMIIDFFLAAALLGGLATGIFCGVEWYFSILIGLGCAVGYFLGLIFLFMLFALICTAFIDKEKPVEGKVRRFDRFMVDNVVDGIIKVARVRVKIENIEKIPTDRRFLLVANHISRFDPMICMAKLRKYHIAFVSKPGNFKAPIAGPFIHRCKFLAIDRENPRNAIRTLNTAAGYISSGELSVGIFPEGTRSEDGSLGEFHDGVFKVARDTHAPIVVMTFRNTEKITKNFPWRPTRVGARVVRVVEPEEYAGMRTGEISALVRGIISDDLAKNNGAD